MKNIMKTTTKADWIGWLVIPLYSVVIMWISSNSHLEKTGQGYWFGRNLLNIDSAPMLVAISGILGYSIFAFIRQKEQWAFLIQRPVSISSIFWSRVLPPLFLWMLAIAGSAFAIDMWRSIPGHYPGPHHFETLFGSPYIYFCGIGIYFSGIAIGTISSCKWQRKTLFAAPLFLAAIALEFVFFSNTHLSFTPIAIFDIIAIATAYTLCRAHGDLARLRFTGKLSLALLAAIGFGGACALILMLSHSFVTSRSIDRYVINADNNHFVYAHCVPTDYGFEYTSHQTGNPINAFDDNEIRRFKTSGHPTESKQKSFFGNAGYLTSDRLTAFYFDSIDNVYKGYSVKTLAQTSTLDSSGFHNASTPGGLNAARLKQRNLIFAENTIGYRAQYLCTPSEVSFADFDTQTVTPLFKTSPGEKIVGYSGVAPDELSRTDNEKHHKGISIDSPIYIASYVVTNRRFVAISGDTKKIKCVSLSPSLPMDRLETFNQTNKGYCLWFANDRPNYRTALRFTFQGKLIERRIFPYRSQKIFNTPGGVFGLASPIPEIIFIKLSPIIDHSRSHMNQSLGFSVAASILSCIGIFLIGLRLRWSIVQIALGLIASILFGVYAPIIAYAIYDFPPLEQCENCGKKRIATLKRCEHCGAPWSIALTGTEIFETQESRSAAFGSLNSRIKKPEAPADPSKLRMKPGKAPSVFTTLLWKEARVVFPSVVITALIGIAIVILQLLSNRKPNQQFFYDTLYSAPIIGFWLAARVTFSELLVAKDEAWSNLILRPVTLSQVYRVRLFTNMIAYLISFGMAFAFELSLAHTLQLGSDKYLGTLLVNGLVASLIGIIGLLTGITRLFFFLFIPAAFYCIVTILAPNPNILVELLLAALLLIGLSSWGAFVGGHQQIKINRISKAAILANMFVLFTIYIGFAVVMITSPTGMRDNLHKLWAFNYKTPSWLMVQIDRPTIITTEAASDTSSAIANDLRSAFLKPDGWSKALELHKNGVRTPEMYLVSDSLVLSGAVALFDSFVSPLEPTAPLSHLRLRDELIALAPIALLAGLLSAALSLLLSHRERLEKKKAIEYASLSVFIGLYAPLIQLGVHGQPLLETCPSCGKQRIITRDKCEHCSGPWPQPTRTGTEIFEPTTLEAVNK